MPKKRLLGGKSRSSPTTSRTLTPKEQRQAEARKNAFHVLRLARRGESLAQAARAVGIKPDTVRKYLPDQFHQDAPGKPWKPTESDRLSAQMNVVTPQGLIAVPVRGTRQRKRLGRYNVALRKWREAKRGAKASLAVFKGQTVGGHTLVTHVKVLARLEDAGLLDLGAELYASVVRAHERKSKAQRPLRSVRLRQDGGCKARGRSESRGVVHHAVL